MASEPPALRVCLRCRRRDKLEGGNGLCPFPRRFRTPFLNAERDCPQFRLGDLPRRDAPIAQTGLW